MHTVQGHCHMHHQHGHYYREFTALQQVLGIMICMEILIPVMLSRYHNRAVKSDHTWSQYSIVPGAQH